MATYILTTTGTVSPVEIPVLRLSLVHPTTIDLINDENFTLSQINEALSIQDSMDAGELTLTINDMDTDTANLGTVISVADNRHSAAVYVARVPTLTTAQYLRISSIPTDVSPIVLPYNAKIQALSYTNSVNNSYVDINIYVNGTSTFTWSITNKRTAYKGLAVSNQIDINRNDYIAIEAVPVPATTNPADIVFGIQYNFKNSQFGTGGNATI